MTDTPIDRPRPDASDHTASRVARLRLDIAYDGTAFHGWAGQPGLRTVQGELEEWIGRILRLDSPVELTCAGRTDAGVHARGQVAHLDIRSPDPEATVTELHRRLRRALPEDVVVRAVSVAPDGFDARFAAVWRRYRYRLTDAGTPTDPLLRGMVVAHPQELDPAAMAAAAPHLLGLRDFAAFCKARAGATTIRTLQRLDVTRDDSGLITVEVQADAFCHSMVRSLVGALVAIGEGRRDLSWLDRTVAAAMRSAQIRVMPAHGLVLEEVGYPPPDQLAARAAEYRAMRRLEEP